MTTTAVTDTDIFVKLRDHVEDSKMLSQLIVDLTNKAMNAYSDANEWSDDIDQAPIK